MFSLFLPLFPLSVTTHNYSFSLLFTIDLFLKIFLLFSSIHHLYLFFLLLFLLHILFLGGVSLPLYSPSLPQSIIISHFHLSRSIIILSIQFITFSFPLFLLIFPPLSRISIIIILSFSFIYSYPSSINTYTPPLPPFLLLFTPPTPPFLLLLICSASF